MNTIEDALLKAVTDFFVSSHDFNGIPGHTLFSESGIDIKTVHSVLIELVEKQRVTIAFQSHQDNPHIKRFETLSVTDQLKKLSTETSNTYCIYPSTKMLLERPNLNEFDARPFSRRLALAEPQLCPVFFELGVLDSYYHDPRYRFDFNDHSGSIVINDLHYQSPQTLERDKVLLDTFGIAYNAKRQRVIVVYLRYLSNLSPEHQQIWQARILTESCKSNSDYARATLCAPPENPKAKASTCA